MPDLLCDPLAVEHARSIAFDVAIAKRPLPPPASGNAGLRR